MAGFDWSLLSDEDFDAAEQILGPHAGTTPDLVIAPDGAPYLYRWHRIEKNDLANVYFHIQVASDPERPLHDHPWDNTSVILAGGYDEIWEPQPWLYPPLLEVRGTTRKLRKKDVVHRLANEAHRLLLPAEFKYAMTLFTSGPKVRDWGFWFPEGWVPYKEVTRNKDGVSVHIKRGQDV